VADSPLEFADAVVSLLEQPELRWRLEKGRDFVRQNFDWQTNLSRLEQLLHQAAGVSPDAEQLELRRAHAN